MIEETAHPQSTITGLTTPPAQRGDTPPTLQQASYKPAETPTARQRICVNVSVVSLGEESNASFKIP
jgi:hypothetical protein